MNDKNDLYGNEQPMGEQLKRRFGGLDPFIPPALPFEQIEGAVRSAGSVSPRLTASRRPGTAPQFRGNAGASLALVGSALAIVVVLGSGVLGPKRDSGPGGSASPTLQDSVVARTVTPQSSSGCSIPPEAKEIACASAGSTSAAGSPAAVRSGLSGSPVQVFSDLGFGASWSPAGTRFGFSTGDGDSAAHTKITDSTGRAVETIQASHVIWLDEDSYLGFNSDSDGYAMHAFVGHIGSTAQQPVAGSYFLNPSDVAAAGFVALPVDPHGQQYVVWTPAGLSAVRPGEPEAISRDGKLLAVDHYSPKDLPGSVQPRLDVVRSDDGSVVASYSNTEGVFGFSPDGTKLAFGPGGTMDDRRFFILDVPTGRVSVADQCLTQSATWLDNARVIVNSRTPCDQPLGSGVTIETTPDWSMAVSSDGKLASVNGQGTPNSAVQTMEIAILSASGEREVVGYSGQDMGVRLSWSPDGSLLLVEYSGPGASNPPRHVVVLRP